MDMNEEVKEEKLAEYMSNKASKIQNYSSDE